MKLVIISGRSGSGKSTALHVLEDIGFYCIDNLPAALIPALIEQYRTEHEKRLAVCIDARNHADEIKSLSDTLQQLPSDIDTEIIYLDANSPILIKRFSETRRKHPLSGPGTSLKKALDVEKQLLEPIATNADLHINTNQMNVYDLRNLIKKRIEKQGSAQNMSVLVSSFGFKNGIPVDADVVFDVRCLPNPHWEPNLRPHTGLEEPVRAFLSQQDDVNEMLGDIYQYAQKWLPKFDESNRSYVTIAIGCTGGKHRSVYIASKLHQLLEQDGFETQIHHRELQKT